MKSILITGGTGLIGSRLTKEIDKSEYQIYILTRKKISDKNGIKYIQWDPDNSILDISHVRNLYSIINLAGESIDGSRWTSRYKRKILESRVNSLKLLQSKVSQLSKLPESFVSASATGYYQENTSKPQNELDTPGENFLSKVVIDWEKEMEEFEKIGVRTVVLRIGLVLSRRGGVLKKLYPLFKFFLGVPIGSGKQIISWIHEKDMVDVIIKAVENTNFSGKFNVVAPERVTNTEFTKSLLKTLGRFSYPNFVKAPSFIIKLIFGEQSNLVLNGLNVSSEKLSAKYQFKFPALDTALGEIFKRNNL